MRLHRLTLSNYRGIAHRDIEFPERGVTVVSGPNEVGKSSMIEALDLLLESKDRSSKKDVKQVKPTHADVGSEVTAEISTGPYRFVYRKRFHKKCETELSILAPRREQLTGDEAHDRVRAMLAETVDTGLWQAQRVLQSASTSAVDLSSCDALSRALDVAASDSAAADLAAGLSSTEPLLIEKIDTEYARYFTATGRPTGVWAAVSAALRDADADVAQCQEALAEVDERVRVHAELTDELAGLTGLRAEATGRLTRAKAAAAHVAALTDELRAAQQQAAAAAATHTAAVAAHRERLRLRADAQDRAVVVDETESAAAEAAESEALGRAVLDEAEQAAETAGVGLGQAQQRVETARQAIAELIQAQECERLRARLARIDAARSELDTVATRLRGITLTDRAFGIVEAAAAAVAMAGAQAEQQSATVTLAAESAVEFLVGDRRVVLAAGSTYDLTIAEVTQITLPGLLTTTIAPGATAEDTQAKLAAAQHTLTEALVGAGVESPEAARQIDQQRRELLAQRDRLVAVMTGLLGDDDEAQLRSRVAELAETQPPADPDQDAVRAELETARAELALAETQCTSARKVAVAAATQLTERTTRSTILREKASAARTESAAVAERLAASRAEIADDELAVRAQAAAETAEKAAASVAELSQRLAQAGPDAAAAELAEAQRAQLALTARYEQVSQALRDVTVQLDTIGTQGRAGKLAAARIRREHAAAEFARVQNRANAARLLRSTMARHRDDTRQRYAEPFRTEVERLGRTVFGASFEVEVDSDLQICSRTLEGRTVPFESLSGGAKEQLGIVARLAVAALVAKEDTVPVMIDDALGFTDPGRLARMAAVFDEVGVDGQVIVLTCTADRYRGITAAHTVELTA